MKLAENKDLEILFLKKEIERLEEIIQRYSSFKTKIRVLKDEYNHGEFSFEHKDSVYMEDGKILIHSLDAQRFEDFLIRENMPIEYENALYGFWYKLPNDRRIIVELT